VPDLSSPFSAPPGGGLPPVPATGPGRASKTGSEGQIFDFIDREIGSEDAAAPSQGASANYRIRRKSGKVFGPFDEATVKKMLAEHQLMGNEEASTDGRTFKPLGAFEEFGQVIRELMEEPVLGAGDGGPPSSSVQGIDDDLDIEVAPRGIEFAEPPEEGEARRGPGAGLFIALALVGLLVVTGVALGFTRLGWFGYKLLTGGGESGQTTSAGKPTDSTVPDEGSVVNPSRMDYFQDTYLGYTSVTRNLENKLKEGDGELEDLYLLGLSYAALLRNYGANPAYVQRGREILEKLKDQESESSERIKVEGALLILTDPAQALKVLEPFLDAKSRDKEALYLAGWAAAYQKNWKEAAGYFDRATVIDPDYAKAYHALGDLQSLQSDFANASLFYEKALSKNPKHVNSAVELARITIEVARDVKQGEELLKVVFGKDNQVLAPSERAKAHHLRAQLHMRKHESEKVIQDLNAAIQLLPERVEYKAILGSYYLDMGEFGQAQEMFESALAKSPKNVDALVGKGRAMWKNGDIVKAKMLLETTGKANPEDPRPAYFLGRIAEDLEQPDEAAKLYNSAIKLAPNNLLARVALARLRLKQGNLKQALDHLTKANKVDPQSAIVRTGLGEVYYIQRNLRLAEVEFREAVKIDPELPSAHFNLANTLRDQKRFEEAQAEYDRAAAISPRYPDLALEQGYSLFLNGKFEPALEVFEAAVRDNPKDDRLYVRAGLAAKAAKQEQTAIKYFQSAAGLNNTNAEAFFQLGLMFQERGENDQALDLFKQAAELDRERAEIRYHMGMCFMAADMVRDAVDEFRIAIKLKPNYVEALIKLGTALLERYQYAEAIKYFQRVVKEDPDRIDVMLALGDAFSQQGQHQKALQIYQKAVKKKPRAPGAAYRLARAFDEMNRKRQAIRYYQQAIKLDASDAMPHYYLGHVYKALGQNSNALTSFKRYLQLRPDAPDADEVRDEIDYMKQE
jgi:tetratricopeptide (TPR) repeat protein